MYIVRTTADTGAEARANADILVFVNKFPKAQRDEAGIIIMELKKMQEAYVAKAVNNYYTVLSIFVLITCSIWYLPIMFTKEKTALHDIILGTRVLKGRAEEYYKTN
jgi:hypothetical protein